MALLYHHMSQLNIYTLLDEDCSIVIFITEATPNCYISYHHTIPPDELHWMTVSGVVPLVVPPMSEMLCMVRSV